MCNHCLLCTISEYDEYFHHTSRVELNASIDVCLVNNQHTASTTHHWQSPRWTHSRDLFWPFVHWGHWMKGPCWGCSDGKFAPTALSVFIPVMLQQQSSHYQSTSCRQYGFSYLFGQPAYLNSFLQSAAQPRSAQNIFFNQHPIVHFRPMSHGDTSQAGAFSLPYPPSPALILPFLSSLWKEGIWHSGYQLPAQSQPRPQAQTPDIPAALNAKLRGKKPSRVGDTVHVSPALSYPTMPFCLE